MKQTSGSEKLSLKLFDIPIDIYTITPHQQPFFNWLCWPPAPPYCRQHCRLNMCRSVGWVSEANIQITLRFVTCETRCLVYLVIHLLQLVVHHLYISHLHLLEVERLNDPKTYQLRSQLGSHDEALIGHHIYMTEQSHDSFTWRLKSMTYRYMTINYMKSSFMTLYLHKQHLHDGSLV